MLVDVFTISGRGTVCTGRVERGVINKGDEVELVGFGPTTKTILTGIGERWVWAQSAITYSRPYRNVPQGTRPRKLPLARTGAICTHSQSDRVNQVTTWERFCEVSSESKLVVGCF